MISLKRIFLTVIFGLLAIFPSANGLLFGCSSDKRRCINSCNERHREGTFSFITRNMCQARCLVSECLLYPNKDKKKLHPADRLKGYSS